MAENQENASRLPKNVVPNHYFLTIVPNFSTFEFTGEETVNVEVREKTNNIVLNSLDIEIKSAVFLSNNQEKQSIKIQADNDREIAVITFENALDVGKGQLKLQFKGEINDQLKGCYRSSYKTSNGEKRYGLCTQFASVYCRRAFPCWDEPALKAKFDLTLVAPKDRVVLSNTPVVEENEYKLDNTKRVFKFATTPTMSTYLLAYLIGEYDFIEQRSKNNTLIRVYTPLNKKDQGKFALDISVRCLEFFEEYFQIPYPLSKLDLIGLSDFLFSAMENWGLITYREERILYDLENSSSIVKQVIALVICHEIAHQWFGNLVTMEWWTHLWLNEGFASFAQYLAADKLLPEYDVWKQFITEAFVSALSLDALHNSHPIEVTVNFAHEVEEIFDAISYRKGASIIRMLYFYIGDKDFKKGMHAYLSKHSYKNAITEKLWDCLEESSGKPIKAIMTTWTAQKGFPVINVHSRQEGSRRVLTLSQEKFSADGHLNKEDHQAQWLIPLNIITQSNSKPVQILLENRKQDVIIENVEPNEWIKINQGMTSFCRINYSIELLEQFKKSIIDRSLPTIDRLNLQNDLFALVLNGKVSTDYVLKFMLSYQNETEQIVWDSIFLCLQKLGKVLAYTDLQESFSVYIRNLLSSVYEKVGIRPVAGESHQTSLLRAGVVSSLLSAKDSRVVKEAKLQFDAHFAKTSLIKPDLRSAIYKAVASDCDENTWNQLFEMYRETDLQEERNRISCSLGATNDINRINLVVEFAMSDEVRNQDCELILSSIATQNKVGRDIVWNFFRKNHSLFRKKYASGPIIERLVKNLIENFATKEKLREVEAFFTEHPIRSTERIVQQSLENIKENCGLIERDSKNIKDFLTSGQL